MSGVTSHRSARQIYVRVASDVLLHNKRSSRWSISCPLPHASQVHNTATLFQPQVENNLRLDHHELKHNGSTSSFLHKSNPVILMDLANTGSPPSLENFSHHAILSIVCIVVRNMNCYWFAAFIRRRQSERGVRLGGRCMWKSHDLPWEPSRTVGNYFPIDCTPPTTGPPTIGRV